MTEKKATISRHHFNLYEDQVESLRSLAYKERTTWSTLARKALDEFLERKGFGPFPERPVVRR